MLYIIYAESANYCGYGQHFVVEAINEDDASAVAEQQIEEYFFDQDWDQLEEDYGPDFEGPHGSVVSVEEFGPDHESWKFYQDPTQAEFYIKVNF